MKRSFGKLVPAALAALVLASFTMAAYDEAAARGGGRGGGGGGRGGGGGGGARAAGGGNRQSAQVNNSRADARTNNVRSSSVNNVNAERNVNVNVDQGCCNGWDNDYHPVAGAVAIGAAVAVTSAVIGSLVPSVPASCVPVNYGGMVYQQCGSTWYQPQGSQFVVVDPPY